MISTRHVVVATTLTAFAMDNPDTWGAWLRNAEGYRDTTDCSFFAAIETDARGIEPFAPVLDRLAGLNGKHWTYHLDDGRTEVTTENRQIHLAMGENLASTYATVVGASHLLFVAADCEPPPDVLTKLLKVGAPVVGAECPTYCLDGPAVEGYGFPVHEQLASAACILLERQAFKVLKWRSDPDLGLSDDPALQYDAWTLLGLPTLVRKDCVCKHYPEAIGPIEARGHDMTVRR
jgi:hypothetical protein